MNEQAFMALVAEQAGDGQFRRVLRRRAVGELPPGEVLVRVAWSSLNYKDALSATGARGITRHYPHTPGIDAAGVVAASTAPGIAEGDQVIVTSYDLGMDTPGGFGQYIRVPAAWVVPLPRGLTLQESMVLGTAGLTAGLSVEALAGTITPDQGEILVTGASGGVGSLSVAILARLGYAPVAVTGKPEAAATLRALGAARIIGREEALEETARPLARPRWAGMVDTVGGDLLVSGIKATQPFGVVTCCGMVASTELHLTIFPFILRGITLAGIDSQGCPMERRRRVWQRLASDWRPAALEGMATVVGLEGLDPYIDTILAGGVTGRVVVDLGT
ncbi:MAG: YhdH/YhfP family quinone oxidoreductase [Gammaproteobacteria bacterium]|nr:YhdH/YhfP family quinone oxidoreductase [Gammaproteobacteria bacterium]